MKIKLIVYIAIAININIFSQVKIGNNPSVINGSSILELESTNKVLVVSRMTTKQMNAVVKPLNGSIVYNIDIGCVYMYNGSWLSLCDSGDKLKVTTSKDAPLSNNIGDFWINPKLNNLTSIWNGLKWITIDNNPRKGNGSPNNTNLLNSNLGDLYVDVNTSKIYVYNGVKWVENGAVTIANNGLTTNSNKEVQLGGSLIKTTIITTSSTNTLGIKGLENGDFSKEDIVIIDKKTGFLKKGSVENLFKEEVTKVKVTLNGQVRFTPKIPIIDPKKVNVYRNGVRIDFKVLNKSTLEIEPEATCYSGDEIKIVQFY